MEYTMTKRVESGEIQVSFHVDHESGKVHVITIASWRGAGHSAFTVSKEEARTDWKRLRSEGFQVKVVTK
jgi:hypothetical protein